VEIFTRANWVDLLVLIVVLRIVFSAFKEGLSHEIFPFIGSIATIVCDLYLYEKMAYVIHHNIKIPLELLNFVSFIAIALAMGFVLKFAKLLLDSIIKVTWHPVIEKFGGIIIGAFRAVIVASMILITLALMPLPYLQWSMRERSVTGVYVVGVGPFIYDNLMRMLPLAESAPSVEKGSLVGRILADKSIGANKPIVDYKSKPPAWEKSL